MFLHIGDPQIRHKQRVGRIDRYGLLRVIQALARIRFDLALGEPGRLRGLIEHSQGQVH